MNRLLVLLTFFLTSTICVGAEALRGNDAIDKDSSFGLQFNDLSTAYIGFVDFDLSVKEDQADDGVDDYYISLALNSPYLKSSSLQELPLTRYSSNHSVLPSIRAPPFYSQS